MLSPDPPSIPSLDPATTQYRVSAGLDLPVVTCDADCSPRCLITWLKDGTPLRQGSQLSWGQVEKKIIFFPVYENLLFYLQLQLNQPILIEEKEFVGYPSLSYSHVAEKYDDFLYNIAFKNQFFPCSRFLTESICSDFHFN